MRNTVRVLSTAELKSALESARKSYHIETDYFSGDDTKIVERIACAQPDVVILNLFMQVGLGLRVCLLLLILMLWIR